MNKILIAECKQEVSTFNPAASSYSDFVISHGDELFRFHRTARNEVGGALTVFDTLPDFALLPAYGARAATSGGTLQSGAGYRLPVSF